MSESATLFATFSSTTILSNVPSFIATIFQSHSSANESYFSPDWAAISSTFISTFSTTFYFSLNVSIKSTDVITFSDTVATAYEPPNDCSHLSAYQLSLK